VSLDVAHDSVILLAEMFEIRKVFQRFLVKGDVQYNPEAVFEIHEKVVYENTHYVAN